MGIAESAFNACVCLSSICIPSSVQYIGAASFAGCDLQTLSFESGSTLSRIGESAFRNTSLSAIGIPSSVEVIGESAFADCRCPSVITFESDSKLQVIEKAAFSHCAYGRTAIRIPASLRTLFENYSPGLKGIVVEANPRQKQNGT
jgi:hypothetical protein